jgi:hypothetical protein
MVLMTPSSPLALRRRRPTFGIAFLALLAAIVVAPLPALASPPGIQARGPGSAAWEVQQADIATLGSPRPELLVKAFSWSTKTVKPIVTYLDEAAKYHQKVLVYFVDTVDYARGTVAPANILKWAKLVRSHPALYGYLSVKEPAVNHITVTEMRSLYNAYKAADSSHPVVALLGDTPNFGTAKNPWDTGIANILWVDWYPVTFSRGYIGTAVTNFPKIKAYVKAHTPTVPIWLMVQGHGYTKGDRRTPTPAELRRQVSDGLKYLGAAGIAFYTWQNPLYDNDFKRNPTLWAAAQAMISSTGIVLVDRP